jgi:hypothetical protein
VTRFAFDRAIAILLVLSAISCGHSTPTAPSSSAAAVSSLAITPETGLMVLQQATVFVATATFSNSTQKAVAATWSSDAPAILRLDQNGTGTAGSAGQAIVAADYQGIRATRPVQVVPEYAGSWDGTILTYTCTDTGDWAGGCRPVPLPSSSMQIVFERNGTSVAGGATPYSDIPTVPLTGTIAVDGHLTAAGEVSYTIPDCTDCRFAITDWHVQAASNQQFQGEFTIQVSKSTLAGSRTWVSTLVATKYSAETVTSADKPPSAMWVVSPGVRGR